MEMEFLNKVQLRGTVGRCHTQNVNGALIAKFSLVTNHTHRTPDGTFYCETTWHNIVVTGPVAEEVADKLEKGTNVEVTGRIRNFRYTNAFGDECQGVEIVAARVAVLGENVSLAYDIF